MRSPSLACVAFAFVCFGVVNAASQSVQAQSIEVKSVILRLIERAEIPARQAGTLLEVSVSEGKVVEEGAVLARIDDVEAQIAVKRAEYERDIAAEKAKSDIEIRAAQEERKVADADLKQAQQSQQRLADSVSASELEHLKLKSALKALQVERAQHEKAVAQLTTSQREADVELARRTLQLRHVTAPFKGTVVEVYRQKGEWVEPGEKILRLIRLDRIRAEGFVDAEQAQRGLEGRTATLRIDLPGRPGVRFAGKVTFVSPEFDPVNRQTRFFAEFENRDLQLQPGVRAALTIDGGAPSSKSP